MNAMPDVWSMSAVLINAAALLLALGFRRNRAVVLLAILTAGALALSNAWSALPIARGLDAIRMFTPWLLLIAVALPERRLLARRNLMVLGGLLLASWLTLAAPAHVWSGLRDALPLGLIAQEPGKLAAILVLLAALVCFLRGISSRLMLDWMLGVALVLTSIALLPAVPSTAKHTLLALAGASAVIGILHASYRMAFVDGLAGLPNRRSLDEALARISGDFALAMVDIDHFKQFNDKYGHAIGDRALRAVAARLRNLRGVRAFRYGGEEFCLLMPRTDAASARRKVLSLLRRWHEQRFDIEGATLTGLSFSAGVADTILVPGTAADLLHAADDELLAAKRLGRHRVRCVAAKPSLQRVRAA